MTRVRASAVKEVCMADSEIETERLRRQAAEQAELLARRSAQRLSGWRRHFPMFFALLFAPSRFNGNPI
jgi:hypothetical protein